ncbi:MAG: hypothetical protein Q7P63_01300 [Verrucomicrobiota bacterium JB022]|nr:hypothetical protein [Verrucomicrobiota bacterium JB022]
MIDGIETPAALEALIERVAAETARQTREDTIDFLVKRGLLTPRGNVKLETRQQQADYLHMPVSTYRLRILPMIKDIPNLNRNHLDRAYKVYQAQKAESDRKRPGRKARAS